MKYVSLIHALNLPCNLDTCGDWHTSALQWNNPNILESDDSIFKDYGIEKDKTIPEHEGLFNVANHIRALLDMLDKGQFSLTQGMRDDFICNSKYDEEIFRLVSKLENNHNWDKINKFMEKEYMLKWIDFRRIRLNNLNIFENNSDWRVKHKEVIIDFLTYLNRASDKFILKGETSLMLCYNSERLSEDIHLDSISREGIKEIVESFCKLNNYSCSIEKNTNETKVFIINYGNTNKPLKVKISFLNRRVSDFLVCSINNIKTYIIEAIAIFKIDTFSKSNKLSDLYDLIFICKNYWNDLSVMNQFNIRNTLVYKGLEFVNYLISTQKDASINSNKLLNDYLDIAEKIGIQL